MLSTSRGLVGTCWRTGWIFILWRVCSVFPELVISACTYACVVTVLHNVACTNTEDVWTPKTLHGCHVQVRRERSPCAVRHYTTTASTTLRLR